VSMRSILPALTLFLALTTQAQPIHLVTEGDSITFGRTAPLGLDYPTVAGRLACALVDREEIVDIAFRSDAWNVLAVLVGSNDLADGADPVALHGAVAGYLARRRSRGYVTLALTVLPRAGVAEAARAQFNALLRASERTVDVGEQPIATVDGIHPGEAGFALMARMVSEAVQSLAPAPCPLPWGRRTTRAP
jgi:hypothetical protein